MAQAIKISAHAKKTGAILAVVVAAWIVLLIAVGSREQVQAPLQLQRTATVESNGIQYHVEADREQYAIGEPVRVRFFQKNLRNEPITLGIGRIEVEVCDSKGQTVWGPLIRSTTWDPTIKIMPMQETEVGSPFLWNQTDNNFKQVLAGTYSIKMSLDGTLVELKIAIVN